MSYEFGWKHLYLIPYMFNGSTYNNIYTNSTFDGQWCEGEPNSLDETCILCLNGCCKDTSCITPQPSFYQYRSDIILSLRLNNAPTQL